MTGLAQVQLPADTDILSVRRKLAYDLYYVRHRNAWLDIQLLAATALKVLGVSYERIGKLALLPGDETIEVAYRDLSNAEGTRTHVEMALPDTQGHPVNVEMASCV